MHKVEDLKGEIVKAAGIQKDALPALEKAKKQLASLTNKAIALRQQVEDQDLQIVSLDAEIRQGLLADTPVDKIVEKRSTLFIKKTALQSLATEIEDSLLPEAQSAVVEAEKQLFEALQAAIMTRRAEVQSELNGLLAAIEADLNLWNKAVQSVQSEFLPNANFRGENIMLTNYLVRASMGR